MGDLHKGVFTFGRSVRGHHHALSYLVSICSLSQILGCFPKDNIQELIDEKRNHNARDFSGYDDSSENAEEKLRGTKVFAVLCKQKKVDWKRFMLSTLFFWMDGYCKSLEELSKMVLPLLVPVPLSKALFSSLSGDMFSWWVLYHFQWLVFWKISVESWRHQKAIQYSPQYFNLFNVCFDLEY